MRDLSQLKVALVHDWLVSSGGAERVLKTFHDMFPEAPIYTLVYDEQKAPAWTRECDIRTTYLQKWPGAKTHHKLLLSLMPKAWEALDFSEYDLVLSSCASCCKGIIANPNTLHICYCHSPIRYVWDLYYEYLRDATPVKRFFMKHLIHKVRLWDFAAAQRPDYFIANSNFVAARIAKFYRRDSVTIYPSSPIAEVTPVETPDDYYLVVSRFVRYKRVDLAIEACNKLGRKLIVIGSGGEEEARLRELAGPTVQFLGRASDEEMIHYYTHAKAFLFPGLEDFGLTPVEAMSYGCPVLAYGKGGATETVLDARTGYFFDEQSSDALAECMLRFENENTLASRADIQTYARHFSEEAFRRNMWEFVEGKLRDKEVA